MYQEELKDKYVDGYIITNPDTGQFAVLKTEEDGTRKRLLMTEIPDWLTPDNRPEGKVNVGYQADKLKKVKPINGDFNVRFLGFAAKEGETPTPKAGTVSYKGQEPVQVLNAHALFEMTDPGWRGNNIAIKLEYSRLQANADGFAYVAGKSKAANLLISLLFGLGFNLNNPIRFSANMLPEIDRRANKARILKVRFTDGWAQKFDFEEDIPGNIWDDPEPVADTTGAIEAAREFSEAFTSGIEQPVVNDGVDPDTWDTPSEDAGWDDPEPANEELAGMA